jgi:hypothetical protein
MPELAMGWLLLLTWLVAAALLLTGLLVTALLLLTGLLILLARIWGLIAHSGSPLLTAKSGPTRDAAIGCEGTAVPQQCLCVDGLA